MDLISRKDMLNLIAGRDYIDRNDLEKDIWNLPAVESRPEGHWVDDIGMFHCSNCKHTEAVKRAFCSHCGARMGSE